MLDKPFKKLLNNKSIEKHDTAAWADTMETKPVSKVTVPCEFNIGNAKEYVEENQK